MCGREFCGLLQKENINRKTITSTRRTYLGVAGVLGVNGFAAGLSTNFLVPGVLVAPLSPSFTLLLLLLTELLELITFGAC